MKIDSTKYTPILKWRRAEQDALRELTNERKDCVLPLIEIVPPRPKSNYNTTSHDALEAESIGLFLDEKKDKIAKEIYDTWGKRPMIVDLTLMHPMDVKIVGLKSIVDNAGSLDLDISITVNISDSPEYLKVVAESLGGTVNKVCIRITSPDLKDTILLNKALNHMLQMLKIDKAFVILLVDLKDETDVIGYKVAIESTQQIDSINEWAGFIVACGAFPADLGDCKRDEDNILPRSDWLNWNKFANTDSIKRTPTFADYTIRHPIYNHSFQFFFPTASPKYTTDEAWIVVKGQQQKNEQYLAGAAILAGDSRFYGENYSAGDSYIAAKSLHFVECMQDPSTKMKPGNTEQWIRAGINHHLSLVADQVSSPV